MTEVKRRHRTRRQNKATFASVAAALINEDLPPANSPDSDAEVVELNPLDFPAPGNTKFSEFLFVPLTVSLNCGNCGLRRNVCKCHPRFACNFGILDKFLR